MRAADFAVFALNAFTNKPDMHRITMRCLLICSVLLLAACAATRWQDNELSVPDVPPTQAPSTPAEDFKPAAPVTVARLLNDYYTDWKGTPYRFGGSTRAGIDCSAFTQQAMSSALGITLPRTTSLQMTRGVEIRPALVRSGDLVFFNTGESVNHVGVMVGPGKFMHASTRYGVTISRTDDRYWAQRLITYRRVID